MKQRKRRIASVIVALFIFTTVFFPFITEATTITNVLYKEVHEEEIRKGISYIKDRRLTAVGWLDTYILKVDLTNPDVRIDVLESTNQYNKRETTTDLIKSNGAVAGINGDFFDMSKNPTASLGMVARDGKLISAYNNTNIDENKWTTFFIDNEGNPFIDYCKIKMLFYNENGVYIGVAGINKITSFKYAVYLDRNSYTSTAEIDSRHPALYKFVVQDGVITYVSKRGETVEIPENGYVIVIDEPTAVQKRAEFKVGQKVFFDLQTSVDLTSIQMALGGAGKIVDKGTVPVNPGHLVSPNVRGPRTALGISRDGRTLYLIAVDGRGQSVGATHSEMTSLLMEYDIYDAIHLDGGGSTTIAAKPMGKDELSLLNKPSDGSERKVVNGLGVFFDAPAGELAGIKIIPNNHRVFQNMPVSLEVIGYDKNLNPVPIANSAIKWDVDYIQGNFSNNVFVPKSAGEGIITAQVGNVKGQVALTCMGMPKALKAHPETIRLKPGEGVNLWVVGLDEEGYKGNIDLTKMTWKVDPSLGTVINGKFIAANTTGQGIIEGFYGDVKIAVPVAIGEKVTPLESFEGDRLVEWSGYPSTVTGVVDIDTDIKYEGTKSIKMKYSFKNNPNVTQAAYVNFKEPIVILNNAKAIGMWVYGDNSMDWLRGSLKDANGQEFLIDFAKEINWTGWKYVQATIPSSVTYPISLSKVYTVTLNSAAERENTIYIDHLSCISLPEIDEANVINSTRLKDKHEKSLERVSAKNSFDITVSGLISNSLDEEIKKELVKQMNENASFSIYFGTAVNEMDIKVSYMKFNNNYQVNDIKNARIIQINASNGGIRAANPEQWKWLQNDLDTDKDNLFIIMDKNPQNEAFSDAAEAELFHKLLKELKAKTNKNIFVISSGQSNQVQILEGVRYICVSGSDLSFLRFRLTDSEIAYEFKPIYN